MQKLGRNLGGYLGERIDIQAVLRDIETAAQKHGWSSETYGRQGEFDLFALHRAPLSTANHQPLPRLYLGAGIHGDEPAGPLAALRLLRANNWPAHLEIWFCPCQNPMGYVLNRRENADGRDLNRDYRNPEAPETKAHIAWLDKRPGFDLCLLLHEDWESHGFYLYEQNPERRASLAEPIIEQVARVCPIDHSELIEGREADGGIIRPNLDPNQRPQWAEAFYLIVNKTRLSYTLEAPSDFALPTRVNALVAAVNAALEKFCEDLSAR